MGKDRKRKARKRKSKLVRPSLAGNGSSGVMPSGGPYDYHH